MGRVEEYREKLKTLKEADWEPYLLKESRLPGPRANLELLAAFIEEAPAAAVRRYASLPAAVAAEGTAREFLAVCGVAALGRLLSDGDRKATAGLRKHASDTRWRIREAVAIALQRLGDADLDRLHALARDWSQGSCFEQRAAVAALCEPRLLGKKPYAKATLTLLDRITSAIPEARARGDAGLEPLRKGLGYGWSVAVVALPEEGLPRMERWLAAEDRDIQWIMAENLKKARLSRLDAGWVHTWQAKIAGRAKRGK
jgi:hypothetical protein